MISRASAVRTVQMMVVLLLAANVAFYAVGYFRPSWAGYLLSVIGRNPACSAGEAGSGIDWHALQNRVSGRFRSQIRLVRSDGTYALWDTPRGRWWTPHGAGEREALAVLLAQQEVEIYGSGTDGPRGGDTVLDCGAHVGLFTRQALAADAARVIAIEPDPGNLECLRRNLAAEIADGRVIVYAKGVWDKEDVLLFRRAPQQSAGGSFVMKPVPGERLAPNIPVTSIDLLVGELSLARVDFIKMDIKGATERALRGAERSIRRHQPRFAIATEEVAYDDAVRITALLRQFWPSYRVACGVCMVKNWRVYPEVVFVRP